MFTDAGAPEESLAPVRTAPSAEPPPRRSLGEAGAARPKPAARARVAAAAREDFDPANELGLARHAYAIAGAAAVVWAGGLAAFVMGFQTRFGAFDYSPLQWTLVAMLAILPAVFIVLAAFAIRQGAKLAAETRRARHLAEDLAVPAALAADHTASAMEGMRREIERAADAARAARGPIVALRETLALESQRLSEAAAEAQATSRLLSETLSRERLALGDLSGTLRSQATEAADALTRQVRVVAEASQLAQTQLDEAQAALTARAADLTVVAGDARQAAEAAGDHLGYQVDRLHAMSENVGDQARAIGEGLGVEREQLASLAETLRADQEDLAARLETQRAQLSEAAADARGGADALNAASADGAAALRSLIRTAADEVRNLAEIAQREQEALATQARTTLGLFSGSLAEERAAIEAQTRAAIGELAAAAEEASRAAATHVSAAADSAMSHAQAARSSLEQLADDVAARIDGIGEAAFAASRQADQAFDSRIAAARRMIEESAIMVEETGERSLQRIEAGLSEARTALSEMETLLSQVDDHMTRLPAETQAQAATVRATIEEGIEGLTAAARRAAEETQAIDAAFQERVRRNYEILSEAVKMMTKVAGAADGSRPAAAAPAAPAAPTHPAIKPAAPVIRPPAAAEPAREAMREPIPEIRAAAAAVGDRSIRVALNETGAIARGGAEPMRPAALSDPFAAEAAPRRAEALAPAPSAASAGLRPRLRLTPTPEPSTPPPRSVAPPSAPAPGPSADERGAQEEWTWKDLLSSMDDPEDDDALAERLIGEINALGVDATALLPRGRIDEIAAALQAGDAGAARDAVRRIAPAAVRRLSRRVLTDKVLRGEADRYVRRYESLLADSARRDHDGYMLSALLGSEPGRAFLLLDAAVGDLH